MTATETVAELAAETAALQEVPLALNSAKSYVLPLYDEQ
jgi:hypothetical protein